MMLWQNRPGAGQVDKRHQAEGQRKEVVLSSSAWLFRHLTVRPRVNSIHPETSVCASVKWEQHLPPYRIGMGVE